MPFCSWLWLTSWMVTTSQSRSSSLALLRVCHFSFENSSSSSAILVVDNGLLKIASTSIRSSGVVAKETEADWTSECIRSGFNTRPRKKEKKTVWEWQLYFWTHFAIRVHYIIIWALSKSEDVCKDRHKDRHGHRNSEQNSSTIRRRVDEEVCK